MIKQYEFFKNGLHKTITVKDHDYDIVEFTIIQTSTDETGKVFTHSKYDQYFTNKEFKEFLTPFINDLKERFDNDIPNSIQE
jgi:hypothetical protein